MRLRTIALLGAAGWAAYRLVQRTGVPYGVDPVRGFDLPRYMGRWYEVARMGTVHERDLTDTTADYALQADGSVHVVNRGWDPVQRRWRSVSGTARAMGPDNVGYYELTLVWPMRASYIVMAVDDEYQHAVVCGPTHAHLWLLSRTPQIRATTRALLLDHAREAGFDVSRLRWVDQRKNTAERPDARS